MFSQCCSLTLPQPASNISPTSLSRQGWRLAHRDPISLCNPLLSVGMVKSESAPSLCAPSALVLKKKSISVLLRVSPPWRNAGSLIRLDYWLISISLAGPDCSGPGRIPVSPAFLLVLAYLRAEPLQSCPPCFVLPKRSPIPRPASASFRRGRRRWVLRPSF